MSRGKRSLGNRSTLRASVALLALSTGFPALAQNADTALKPIVLQGQASGATDAKGAADAPTRDYYRIEDMEGRRYWLFRQGLYEASQPSPRWFMHGIFP